jgi:uncharacterized membrane protein
MEQRMKRYLLASCLLISNSALAVENMECAGTEPFWKGTFASQQIIFDFSGVTKTYANPTYSAAAGVSDDYVVSVQASGKAGQLTAFIVNEGVKIVADMRGKAPDDQMTYKAYCSDGMSDRGFPFSVHLIVDGHPYTGCCANAANPPVGPKE